MVRWADSDTEDEEIDDVSLLGTGKKRRKKKKYVPTRAEIWHEADRLWMMAELLEREKEREERRAQRLALTGSELEPVPPPGSPRPPPTGDSPRFTATSRGKSRSRPSFTRRNRRFRRLACCTRRWARGRGRPSQVDAARVWSPRGPPAA